MEITTDIQLKGETWRNVIEKFSFMFKDQPHYKIFMLALSIGIMRDKMLYTSDSKEKDEEKPLYVPRNVLYNQDQGRDGKKLETMFQAAVLTSNNLTLKEEERLELAFEEKNRDFNALKFLTGFANYGAKKLETCIGYTDLDTLEKLKDYLIGIAENVSIDEDEIPLEELEKEFL